MVDVHMFSVADACKHGITKAVLLQNLKFWLTFNKANRTNIKKDPKSGKSYHWTYNSAGSLKKLFPYIGKSTIERILLELEKEGVLIVGNFNKSRMDRTKWFTMVGFEAAIGEYDTEEETDDTNEGEQSDAEAEYDRVSEAAVTPIKSGGTSRQDEGTIPDVTTDSIYNSKNKNFSVFMEEKGFSMFEYPTADDGVQDAWGISPNKKLSPGKLKSLELEYKRLTGNTPDAKQSEPVGGSDDVKTLFGLFSKINPGWKMFFKNKNQRTAAEELLSRDSIEGLKRIIEVVKLVNAEDDIYAPKIYSPYDLITKMNKLKFYAERWDY